MSQGGAGAAIERPQRGERCIALRAIAARGEASPRVERRAVKRVGVMVCWGDGVLGWMKCWCGVEAGVMGKSV